MIFISSNNLKEYVCLNTQTGDQDAIKIKTNIPFAPQSPVIVDFHLCFISGKGRIMFYSIIEQKIVRTIERVGTKYLIEVNGKLLVCGKGRPKVFDVRTGEGYEINIVQSPEKKPLKIGRHVYFFRVTNSSSPKCVDIWNIDTDHLDMIHIPCQCYDAFIYNDGFLIATKSNVRVLFKDGQEIRRFSTPKFSTDYSTLIGDFLISDGMWRSVIDVRTGDTVGTDHVLYSALGHSSTFYDSKYFIRDSTNYIQCYDSDFNIIWVRFCVAGALTTMILT